MLAANAKGMRLATLTTRGQIQCFKVKDRQALDSFTLEYQASVQEPLKIQQQAKNDLGITVKKISILDEDSLLAEFSDLSKFLFDLQIKTWC